MQIKKVYWTAYECQGHNSHVRWFIDRWHALKTIVTVAKRGMIVTICVASSVVIASMTFIAYQLLQKGSQQAEDFLPFDATLAIVQHMDEENMERLEQMFPALGTIPKTTEGVTAALMRTPAKKYEWLLLEKNPQGVASPFTMEGSAEAKRVVSENTAEVVRRSRMFQHLSKTRKAGDGWVYLAPDIMQSATGSVLPKTAMYGALIRRGGLQRFIYFPRDSKNGETAEREVILAFDIPFFIAALPPSPEFLANIGSMMEEQEKIVATALMERQMQDVLGPHIDVRHDLAPLFQGQSSLQLSMETGSGSLKYLLASERRGEENTRESLATLRKKFVQGLSAAVTLDRILEEGFSVRDIRWDPSSIEESTETINGWEIAGIWQEKNGRALFTGEKNRRIMLSNSREAIERLARDQGQLPSVLLGVGEAADASFQAGGYIVMEQLSHFVPEKLLRRMTGRLPFTMDARANFLWTMEGMETMQSLNIAEVLRVVPTNQTQRSSLEQTR